MTPSVVSIPYLFAKNEAQSRILKSITEIEKSTYLGMLREERPLRKRRKLYFEVRNKADVPLCKLFVIGSRGEQHHQREYLQTSEQHLQR